MPNKRDPNKKSLSFWIENETKERLETFCQKEGITKSQAVSQILESMLDELETQGDQKPQPEKATTGAKQQ